MRTAELVRKGVHGILDERGNPSGVHAMPRHIADKKPDTAILGLKDIIEVATDLGFFGSGAIEVSESDLRELVRDVKERHLQPVKNGPLLLQKATGLCLGPAKLFVLGLQLLTLGGEIFVLGL